MRLSVNNLNLNQSIQNQTIKWLKLSNHNLT